MSSNATFALYIINYQSLLPLDEDVSIMWVVMLLYCNVPCMHHQLILNYFVHFLSHLAAKKRRMQCFCHCHNSGCLRCQWPNNYVSCHFYLFTLSCSIQSHSVISMCSSLTQYSCVYSMHQNCDQYVGTHTDAICVVGPTPPSVPFVHLRWIRNPNYNQPVILITIKLIPSFNHYRTRSLLHS